jgi:3-oxoacyl-[acyl-carrier-protein] synthase-3
MLVEMKQRRAKITALGRYVPPKVVTNYDLSKLVDTNHEWIVERTGIVERRWVEPGTPNSELAARAASDLLKQRGIEAAEIDLITISTVTPDMFFPQPPAVQDKIGASKAWGFDLSAACSGFYGLTVGLVHHERRSRQVMVIGSDVCEHAHRRTAQRLDCLEMLAGQSCWSPATRKM